MQRSQVPLLSRAVVLPRWKTVFVVNPKVACTSLLWLVAGLQDEDPESFRHSFSPEVTRRFTVHDKARWARTPDLADLSDDALAQVQADQGWFVFAVTRHPLSRVWSAWVSKLLMREPAYDNQYSNRTWFPRRPYSSEAILEDFGRFVAALRDEPGLLQADGHWMTQYDVLNFGALEYSHVGRLEDMATTLRLLEQHLAVQGWSGTLELSHSNRGLLKAPAGGFDPMTVAAVEQIYGCDFRAFGYPPSGAGGCQPNAGPPDLAPPLSWFEVLDEIVDRHERYSDLFTIAATLYNSLGSTAAQLNEAREALAGAEAQLQRERAARGTVLSTAWNAF